MALKQDIQQQQADLLAWNQFDGKPPAEALPAIYNHALAFSTECRGWYWRSIRNKRLISLLSRVFTFALVACGIAAPLVAAIWTDQQDKLLCSQLAVVALALAGVVQLADRVFGWSSGWLRYISTVTAMENLTRKFQMEWGLYFVNLQKTIAAEEIRPLVELAQRFQIQLGELQASETDGWIAEFNSGSAMLSEVIKASREAADKYEREIQSATKALEQASATGSIELTFTTSREPPPQLRVSIDGGHAEVCKGLSWARLKIEPGHHHVVIQAFKDDLVIVEVARVIELSPGGVARLTLPI